MEINDIVHMMWRRGTLYDSLAVAVALSLNFAVLFCSVLIFMQARVVGESQNVRYAWIDVN